MYGQIYPLGILNYKYLLLREISCFHIDFPVRMGDYHMFYNLFCLKTVAPCSLPTLILDMPEVTELYYYIKYSQNEMLVLPP